MKDYEMILFDLDGTLTDSLPGIFNSVKYGLRKRGHEVPPDDVLRFFIGPPLLESFEKYCGITGNEGWETLLAYREYFNVKGYLENSVYPGVPECLARLKAAGKRLIVATSKPENFAQIIIEHFGLAPYFELVAGASLDETRVEKADVIRYALEECRVTDPSQVIMVGDRKHDVQGAASLGMECIGVLYGYGNREELEEAGAAYIAGTPEAVADLILKN